MLKLLHQILMTSLDGILDRGLLGREDYYLRTGGTTPLPAAPRPAACAYRQTISKSGQLHSKANVYHQARDSNFWCKRKKWNLSNVNKTPESILYPTLSCITVKQWEHRYMKTHFSPHCNGSTPSNSKWCPLTLQLANKTISQQSKNDYMIRTT